MKESIDLRSIKSPADIKHMDIPALTQLSEQLRCALVKKLAIRGGHVGPNLGVVEATVALHYVFDAPKDKIVFDVSHQSYAHKMLTGRMEAFTDPAHYGDVTGYTCPRESEYDLFAVGHTSTSLSLAAGLARARDVEKGDWNVVAFIGDASLGGGMALEALQYAPEEKSNLIIVLNDNQMSIAENHGEFFEALKVLRDSNGTSDNNLFKALGYDYLYVREGNDLKSLIAAYRSVKDTTRPTVVHINTMKGLGLPVAESRKEAFHWSVPFNPEDGAPSDNRNSKTYTDIFAEEMLQLMRENPKVVTVNAGTPGAIGFTPARRKAAGRQFVDVGICEQNAVAMTAGMAKGGLRPVFGVMASFAQRAYDQFSHDIALNNLPVTVVDFGGGVFGVPDMTHLGFFDIAMLSNIPNLVMIAPATEEEYRAYLRKAVGQTEHFVVIRTPGGNMLNSDRPVDADFFRYDVVKEGKDVAVIAVGGFLGLGIQAVEQLSGKGVEATLINPRNISQLDEHTLDTLKGYRRVVTVEDGIIDGGFGQKVAGYLSQYGVSVRTLGLKKEFLDRYKPSEVLKANGLTADNIAAEAMA